MRFSLFDLLLAVVAIVPGYLLGDLLGHFLGHAHWGRAFGLPLGFISYFFIAPAVYRLLHLRALSLPLCPHCHDRNRWWRFETPLFLWPRDVVICSTCKGRVELWYKRPPVENISRDMPSFLLLWPQSWGRWRRIEEEEER